MKRLVFLLALAIAGVAGATEARISDLSGGMQTTPSENKIPDNAAQYIQNFYTDTGQMAIERNGYVKADSTVLGGTATVPGLWTFRDSNGDEWSVRYSSQTYYKNKPGDTPTAFGPISTTSNIPDAAVNLGKIMFTNGVDNVWWFDGTSTGAVSSAPKGRLIEAWRNRFVIANAALARSTVRFSQDGDGTNWTLGGNSTDPFAIQIGGANDGEYVRCLGGYSDSLIIGRKRDLWAADGFDQGDLTVRNIANQVGCLEDGTMREGDNELLWLSNRGIEGMSGRTITLLSEPIRTITDSLTKNSASQRSRTYTTASDFGSGTFDNAYADTMTVSGQIRSIFPETWTTLRDGSSGTKPVWAWWPRNGADASTSIVSGRLRFSNNGHPSSSAGSGTRSVSAFPLSQSGTTVQFTISNSNFAVGGGGFIVNLSTWVPGPGDAFGAGYQSVRAVFFTSAANTTGWKLINLWYGFGGGIAAQPFFFTSPSFTLPMVVQVYVSPSGGAAPRGSVTVNNVLVASGSLVIPDIAAPQYVVIQSNLAQGGGNTDWIETDDFSITPSSFTWTSPVAAIGNSISSWGPVAISEAGSAYGSFAYQFNSSTASTVAQFNSSSWTAVSNGASPSISTAPYAAVRATITCSSSTDCPALDETTLTWNEGSTAPPPVATVYDRRYWLSYTTSTATSPYLDSVLVLQRNKSWTTLKGINAASFRIWQDYLYFGNSMANGYVYKFDIGNNDDGSAISSIIQTKSYDLGAFHTDKDFRRVYLAYQGDTAHAGSLDLSYTVDESATVNDLGLATLSTTAGHVLEKYQFPLSGLPLQGREISLKVSKSTTGARLKLYDLLLDFDTMEPR